MLAYCKPIPRQNSRSPRLTDDYFDEIGLKIIAAGRLHGFDMYYPVVNAIYYKYKKVKLWETDSMLKNPDPTYKFIEYLKSIGFEAEREHVSYPGVGWGKQITIKV